MVPTKHWKTIQLCTCTLDSQARPKDNFNTNLKIGVVDHFMDKKRVENTKINKKKVDNTKFKTNLTVQAVCIFEDLYNSHY
jgi:hypothetical protein